MALPKINELPSYELVIPSTQQKIEYRPFLVKEQKILMMALETQDEKTILKSIVDTIKSCVTTKMDVQALATFDIEYLFTQIRAKSVGEKATVNLKCGKCEQDTQVEIPLDKVNINLTNVNKKIKLNDQYTIVMKYPNFKGILLAPEDKSGDSLTESILELVIMCMDKLQTEEEQIEFANETKQAINDFLESLNTQQFEKLVTFVNNLPKLTHKVNYTCEHCNEKNQIILSGIQDFF